MVFDLFFIATDSENNLFVFVTIVSRVVVPSTNCTCVVTSKRTLAGECICRNYFL